MVDRPDSQPLEYARPTSPVLTDARIVEVRSDGVLLRIDPPTFAGEAAHGVTVTAFSVIAGALAALMLGWAEAWMHGALLGAICVALAFGSAAQWRRLGQVRRGDPSVQTLFLVAADEDPTMDGFPARKLVADRGPLEVTLRRTTQLYVKTSDGAERRLLRGRPLDELKRLEADLRLLLRLDARARGFPVVPVGVGGAGSVTSGGPGSKPSGATSRREG